MGQIFISRKSALSLLAVAVFVFTTVMIMVFIIAGSAEAQRRGGGRGGGGRGGGGRGGGARMSRPAPRPSSRPSYSRPASRPSYSRPATRPSTGAVSRPATRPATRPSTGAVTRPGTRPGAGPGYGQAGRPGQLPDRRPGGGIRDNNINTGDINIDRDVNIDDGWGGWDDDWDDFWGAAAVVGAGVAIGSALTPGTYVYSLPPSCTTSVVNGVTYQYCGGTYYAPTYQGTSVAYEVVPSPY